MGSNHVVHARVHEVLEEDLLRSLLRVDARVVGQIVRHGLVAVVQVARAQRRIDDLHRRRLALLRRPVFRWNRQRLLHRRLLLAIQVELAALRLIANQDRASIGGLHSEDTVEIRLIRRKDQIDLWIFQVEPRNIARVVIVGQQGLGAQVQIVSKGRVIAQLRRRAQIHRHRPQPLSVCLVVGNDK